MHLIAYPILHFLASTKKTRRPEDRRASVLTKKTLSVKKEIHVSKSRSDAEVGIVKFP